MRRIKKFLATSVVAVMMVSAATGCTKSTAGKCDNPPVPTVNETHAAVSELKNLADSNATSMKWEWYEETAAKLEDYQFTDYKTLKYADEYTKDRVEFTAASERLKDELSDYEQYYQIAKMDAIFCVKDAFKNAGIDANKVYDIRGLNVEGNDVFKGVCEVYPIDFCTETNRLIYFAGMELSDGSVSEMIGSIEFEPEYQEVYGSTTETEAVKNGGKIQSIGGAFTTDNDLVTQKFTMDSYIKDARNNSAVVKGERDIKAR